MADDAQAGENGDVHILSQVAVLNERTRFLAIAAETHAREVSGIYARLWKIERLMWIGIGGGVSLWGAAVFFGWNLLKTLGK